MRTEPWRASPSPICRPGPRSRSRATSSRPPWSPASTADKPPSRRKQDYRIRKGLTIREEISTAFRVGQSHFDAFRKLQNPSVEATRRFVRDFLAETFGFDDLAPADGAVSFLAGGRVPVVVVPPSDEKLDRRSPTLSTDRSRSPASRASGLSQRQRSRAVGPGHKWGGDPPHARQRLVDAAGVYRSRPCPDIHQRGRGLFRRALVADPPDPVRRCRRTRRPTARSNAGARPASREGEAARDRLAAQVEIALKVARLRFPRSQPRSRRPAEIRRGQPDRMVQRASAPRLSADLPDGGRGPEPAPPGDGETGGAQALRRRLQPRRAARAMRPCARPGTSTTTVTRASRSSSAPLPTGRTRLPCPPSAALFGDDKLPHLETARLRNRAFMEALYRLSWLADKTGMVPVNWRAMETEELGSVYEIPARTSASAGRRR